MTMNVIELFAGAAGLAQGFREAEVYETVALYDIFEPAQRSYLAYAPESHYELLDVRDLQATQVQDVLNGRVLHGILGGPPCQGFSPAGKRLTDDEINQLILSYARVVNDLEPYFLVMENVPQLLFHQLFEPLLRELRTHYKVTYGILNAACYGVPQTRHRLFLVAYHHQFDITPSLPAPTHGQLGQRIYAYHLNDPAERLELNEETASQIFGADPVITRIVAQQAIQAGHEITQQLEPLVTVGDAISDLVDMDSTNAGPQPYNRTPESEYQRLRRHRATNQVTNCVARRHTGRVLQLGQALREGGLPNTENGGRNKRYYSQAYGRLHRSALARTLTTYFQNAGSGRFFHYSLPRTLTIREGARLQGFSDDFAFYGSLAHQMQLVGNAVPLPLAKALGSHIANELGPHLPT